MNAVVVTVSQLNAYLKSVIDGDYNLNNIYIAGEISNFTNHYRTGHYYMTLKDEKACVRAVMFKGSNIRLKFMPENGMSVIARGRVSVFERDGQYQLYIDDMQPDGAGALSVAFEQLKLKLESEGLFDKSVKPVLPECPMRVGVITSPTGAAVRDIFNVLSRRFPLAKVIFCPVQVQGDSASGQIADAIERFNAGKYADVLIVGRGGGSLEELWAFNEERTARAVAASKIPIISAVGHETDFTICDFAATLRAPTPSAAAELAVPDETEQRAYISGYEFSMRKSVEMKIRNERMKLGAMSASKSLSNPIMLVNIQRQILDGIMTRLYGSPARMIETQRTRLGGICGKLDALSPLAVLSRGYAVAMKDGCVVSDADKVNHGDKIDVRVKNGVIGCTVD